MERWLDMEWKAATGPLFLSEEEWTHLTEIDEAEAERLMANPSRAHSWRPGI